MNVKFNPYQLLESFNGAQITPREADVIACILNGRTSKKSIATFLTIEARTAETHVRNLMKKLKLSSWEQIRDAFSNSTKALLYKKHFEYLLFEKDFITLLNKLPQKNLIQTKPLLLLIDNNLSSVQTNIIRKIRNILSQAYYSCSYQSTEKEYLISHTRKQNYCVAVNFTSDTVSQKNLSNGYKKIITVTFNKDPHRKRVDQKVININDYHNIFHLILSILCTVSTNHEILDAVDRYSKIDLESTISTNLSAQHSTKRPFVQKKLAIVLVVSLFALGVTTIYLHDFVNNTSIYNVPLPPESEILLTRQETLNKINKLFFRHSDPKRNPAVILSGIGGAGKTTIARLWTQGKHSPQVAWEMNAETPETITSSLQSLANQLATTGSAKAEITQIEALGDSKEKSLRRISFIQKHLQQKSNWIIIFDNVDSFESILNILPLDPKIWGKGKILITTRNAHFKHGDWISIKNAIEVAELSRNEQTKLFTKVYYKYTTPKPLRVAREEIEEFMKVIPPYPLDIAISAKYLARSQSSIKNYINELSLQKKLLSQKEEAILKETSNYTKTRHAIIALATDRLILENQGYRSLLLLFSILDPIQMPVDLLIKYSSSDLTEQLLTALKKSSLCELSRGQDQVRTLSFHRSLHDHMKSHLLEITTKEQLDEAIRKAKEVMKSEINNGLTQQNHFYVKHLIQHAETLCLSSSNQSLKNELIAAIGGAYYEFGHDIKAIACLEPLLQLLSNCKLQETFLFGRVSAYLGIIAMRRGEFEKSIRYLKQSIPIYQRSIDISGYERALVFLGHVQTLVDNFSEADSTLNQAIQLCRLHLEDSANLARALVFQGILYRETGNYLKALEATEKSIQIYKEGIPKIWALAYLGSIELERGNYEFAKSTLTKSINYYRKHNAHQHVSLGWILPTLASVHRKTGNYSISISICQEASEIFKKTNTADNQNLATEFPSVHIGKAYRLNGKLDKAKPYLEKGVYTHLRLFGSQNLRTKWAEVAYAQYCIDEGEYLQAKKLLTSALSYYKTNLPHSHPKIGKVFRELALTYLKLGSLEDAEYYINKATQNLISHYSTEHLETGHTLLILGKLRTQQRKFEQSEKALKEALRIYEENKHPHQCFAHEALSQMYYVQFALIPKTSHLIKLSKAHLKKAIKIAKDVFPKDTSFLSRLSNKTNLPDKSTYTK